MARKPWSELTPAVQRRYLRHGIGPTEHAAGASVQKARGHGQTPEHPNRVTESNRDRYERYLYNLQTRVIRRKERDYGDRIKLSPFLRDHGYRAFDRVASARAVREADMDDPDVIDAMRRYLAGEIDADTVDWAANRRHHIYDFLFYHP